MLEKVFGKSFNYSITRAVFLVIVCLMVSLLIDTSVIKLYDLLTKNIVSIETREIFFSLNASISLLLQFILLRYIRSLIRKDQLGNNFPTTG